MRLTSTLAKKVIEDNYSSSNNSFLGFLHEQSYFNEVKFWEFYNAIRLMGKLNSNEINLDRNLTWKIVSSYEWFLLNINFHFDINDSSKIKNLPENITQYTLRLREVFDAYIKGDPISDESEKNYNLELQNPQTIIHNN